MVSSSIGQLTMLDGEGGIDRCRRLRGVGAASAGQAGSAILTRWSNLVCLLARISSAMLRAEGPDLATLASIEPQHQRRRSRRRGKRATCWVLANAARPTS